jgi:hypothetical protein
MKTLGALALTAALCGVGCSVAGEDTFGNRGLGATGDAGADAGATSDAGTGGAGGQGGGGGSGGSGPTPDPTCGCADGFREAFLDRVAQPNLAGCAGAFDVPGVTTPESLTAACGREAGDDGKNPSGLGCSVEDLCSAGWHVCKSGSEVAARSATGGCESPDPGSSAFWLTRQSQTEASECAAPVVVNNLVGCGNLGAAPAASCAPLLRVLGVDECIPSAAWFCGSGPEDALREATIVKKTGLAEGGVLCCRD